MKKIMPKSAGVLIALFFYLILNLLYAVLGTVDLVYVKDGEILCRQDNVCMVSIIEDPVANMDEETKAENPDLVFTYVNAFGEEREFKHDDMLGLRIRIGFTVIYNLVTIRWSDISNTIILTAQ